MKSLLIQLIDEELNSNSNLQETGHEFIERISQSYYKEISHLKMYAPFSLSDSVLDEIRIEVRDIYRVKTYGFYSLQSYRRNQLSDMLSTEVFSAQKST